MIFAKDYQNKYGYILINYINKCWKIYDK